MLLPLRQIYGLANFVLELAVGQRECDNSPQNSYATHPLLCELGAVVMNELLLLLKMLLLVVLKYHNIFFPHHRALTMLDVHRGGTVVNHFMNASSDGG